ncbi:hypothetical protein [Streptomyces sp. NPDC058644]|uniref:hypothetical protein n=1 Tax=unclassified Streptomyces TaxID=2593676 RepID=UPI00364FEF1F
MTHHREISAVAHWLSEAQAGPELAWREWNDGGVAILPCGSRFCAIRIPVQLVYAAVGTSEPKAVDAALAARLDGPVILDRQGQYEYALTELITQKEWPFQREAPLLGDGTYLGVPKAERDGSSRAHWAVPPRFPGHLCSLQAVEQLVAAGCASLAEEQ